MYELTIHIHDFKTIVSSLLIQHQGGFNQATGNMTDKSGVLKHDYGVPTPENGFLRFRGPQGQDDSGK